MKKLATCTIIFFFMNSFFAACCLIPTTCGCGENKNSSYRASDFSLSTFLLDANGQPDFTKPLPAGTAINHTEFTFVFTPVIINISAQQKLSAFPGSAYACDISDNPMQEFNSIKITSNQVYATASGVFAAGEDLISLFTLSGLSIPDFIAGLNRSVTRTSFTMVINQAPIASSVHQFTFMFHLSDGGTFTIVSDSIELN
ncbi:MAG: hypothetical protein KF856_12450 [Cyclobacteriaceae bacterium]|nr:hypothetical protein [Cyclobacteriaceae bacterium]